MMRAAVFDVDGTLLDSMSVWEDLGVRYLRTLGIEPQAELGDILFSMTMEEGAEYIRRQYHLTKKSEEITEEILGIIKAFYVSEVPLKNGAAEFLEALHQRGIPMAAATSGERELVEAAFQRLGILKYFRNIFTCTEVGEGKNSPLIYLRAAEFLEAEPEETWVFEDALHALLTAAGAGFRTAAVFDTSSQKEQKKIREAADIYLYSLTEFDQFWNRASQGK